MPCRSCGVQHEASGSDWNDQFKTAGGSAIRAFSQAAVVLALLANTSGGRTHGNVVRVIGTRHRLDWCGRKRLGCVWREWSWIIGHRLGRINRRVVVGVWTWLGHVDSPT